jgi:diguanylate cyclase (GGDEF)-like protein/PAS domain S-box-containing protein
VWQVLVANLAVVSLFISVWAHVQNFLEMRSPRYREMLFALFMGAGAVATMSLPVELQPGMHVDLRNAIVSLAGYFAGPIGALITGAFAIVYRLALGGAGATAGTVGIVFATGLGVAFHGLARGRPHSLYWLLGLALSVTLLTTGSFAFVPPRIADNMADDFVPVVGALTFAATFLPGFALIRGRQLSIERSLLRAAVAQAPDYFYVKDTASRFVAVNRGSAEVYGFSRPDELEGKSDFDILPPDKAQQLFEAERQIVETGTPLVGHEEELVGPDGQPRWVSTSKSPLRDVEGKIIGLVGVTRDITARRQLEREAARNHHLLSFALTEMSDGLAMFDRDGVLVMRNQRYAESFPLTGHLRVPGVRFRDILEAVVETGEQLHVPHDDPQGWIRDIEASLRHDSQEEVSLADGRWLQIRTRPTKEGSSLVVVSDVTTIKKAELALLGMTDQLRELATTDGLTGLLNRRSLDQILAHELSRTGHEHQALSVLMIDVDHFKAYNDRYGHLAGDKCLKLVAGCLREAALRPGDSLARYGGEEFVAILPNTDEDGAFILAERLRRRLHDLGLPHEACDRGIVTVSVGIASYAGTVGDRVDTVLLRRADEALYDAKAAGRDRVTGWRGTREVTPRRAEAG